MTNDEIKSVGQLKLERDELELEKLREEVGKMRERKALMIDARRDQEKGFLERQEKFAQMQSNCNHRKGGKDYASMQKRGDGDNHSLFMWVDPLGRQLALCSHCLFLWEPGVSKHLMKDGRTKNPTGISWQEAVKLPTDNTPSSSVMFGHRPQQPGFTEAA